MATLRELRDPDFISKMGMYCIANLLEDAGASVHLDNDVLLVMRADGNTPNDKLRAYGSGDLSVETKQKAIENIYEKRKEYVKDNTQLRKLEKAETYAVFKLFEFELYKTFRKDPEKFSEIFKQQYGAEYNKYNSFEVSKWTPARVLELGVEIEKNNIINNSELSPSKSLIERINEVSSNLHKIAVKEERDAQNERYDNIKNLENGLKEQEEEEDLMSRLFHNTAND